MQVVVFYTMVFLTGLISLFSPHILPLFSVYMGVVIGDGQATTSSDPQVSTRKIVYKALSFITGFAVVFILLGALAGWVGEMILHGPYVLNLIVGITLVGLSLTRLGVISWPHVSYTSLRQTTAKANLLVENFFAPFGIALLTSIALAHCIAPILTGLLLIVGAEGSALHGLLIMTVFSFGLAIALLFITVGMEKVVPGMKLTSCGTGVISTVLNLLLLGLGLLLLFDRVELFINFFEHIIPHNVFWFF